MSIRQVACILMIVSLCLVPMPFLASPAAASTGLYIVAYNPYAGVDWDTTFRLKTELHAQSPLGGDWWAPSTTINNYAAAGFDALGISDLNKLTWPWSQWDEFLSQAALNMVPIPNDEVAPTPVHFVAPFISSAVNGSNYGTNVQGTIDAINAVGGLPFIAHPESFGFTSLTTADSWTGFRGIEIYNPVEGPGLSSFDFELWDHLLTDPGRGQKHIWGIAVDDSYSSSDMDLGWIIVYASQKNAAGMKASIAAGSFVAVVNSTATINNVTQVGNTLVVDTSSPVVWKADGQQVVGTSSTLDLDALGPGYTYVRAEVDGAVFTQPIFLTQTSPWRIFSNGFEDGFASWDNTVMENGGFIGQSSDTARLGSYSAKISAIRDEGDKAYANKSLGGEFKRIHMRAYVNFAFVSTANVTIGPLSLRSSNGAMAARAAVVRDFASSKWAIRTVNSTGTVALYREASASVLEINRWYCIELEAAMSVHGFATLWIDGNMILNVTNINYGSSTITHVNAGVYNTPYALSTFIKYYLDEVVVADSYIGPLQYGLTVGVSGQGTTNATGTSMHYENTNVTVLAMPDTGYYFDHWLRNGTNVGSANPYTIKMTTNYNLTAVFMPSLTIKSKTAWYWADNTTINSVIAADVDGDGSAEIVTGGSFNDGMRDIAQLVVWNGSTMEVENVVTWYWYNDTVIKSVAVGDVDGDSYVEIVTGGFFNDGTRDCAQLVVWDGATLAFENVQAWYWVDDTRIDSVAIADVDGDSYTEIVTGGYFNDTVRAIAQLVVWNGSNLAFESVQAWYWTSNTQIHTVTAGDVDGDSFTEIVTGGYFNDGVRDIALLVVWDGGTLAVEAVQAWYWTGNTRIYSVAAGDVDGDSAVEVVTGGFYWDSGEHAQLVVWSGSGLAVENFKTLTSGTATWIVSVTIADPDADGSMEIVTGGYYYDAIFNAELCVWEGSTLASENVRTWYETFDTAVLSVAAGDVDGDSSIEIITGGYYSDLTRSWAQLATWQTTTAP